MSRRRTFAATLVAALLVSPFLHAGVLLAEPVEFVVLEPNQGKLLGLLRREVARATALDRVPFLEIMAEWCAPCKALRRSLGDPLMQDAFAGTYIIQVDFDAWADQLKPAGFDHPAIPVFFAVGGNARPTGAKIDGSAWGKDIPGNMAPPLKRFFGDQIARSTIAG